MSGVVRACLLVGAAARLSLILEMHTRRAPHAPKLAADLRNKVANISGLNSTDISVEKLPDDFFFPCPEVLASDESESETAVLARQLHGKQDARVERGFLGYHGRNSRFPILLEVRGVTSGKLIHDLRTHVTDLTAAGCETAGQPCKVTFALYECRVRESHHRHHGHFPIPSFAGVVVFLVNLCFLGLFMRVICACICACCGGRRGWRCCPATCNATAVRCPMTGSAPAVRCPFLQTAAQSERRIVNGVIVSSNAPSAGPAVPSAMAMPAPTAPAPTAPPPTAPPVVQPAGVYPVPPAAPAAPVYVPMSQPEANALAAEESAQLERALALSQESAESAQLDRALALSLAEATRYCSTCGAANPIAHRFCAACGQPLQPGVSPAAGLGLQAP